VQALAAELVHADQLGLQEPRHVGARAREALGGRVGRVGAKSAGEEEGQGLPGPVRSSKDQEAQRERRLRSG
jgi:hypothetical protein